MADVDPAFSDSGYLTYIITTSRITSGELLKYRNGLLMTELPRPEAAPKNCSDNARLSASSVPKGR